MTHCLSLLFILRWDRVKTEVSNGLAYLQPWSPNCLFSTRRRSRNTQAPCSRSSWASSTHPRKCSKTVGKFSVRSSTLQISSKRTHRSSTRSLVKKVLAVSRECSAAWGSAMANYLRSNSRNRRGPPNAKLLRMKSASCRWARAVLSCSATKLLTSRIVSGSSWSSWTVELSPLCSKNFKASTLKSIASIAYGGHARD